MAPPFLIAAKSSAFPPPPPPAGFAGALDFSLPAAFCGGGFGALPLPLPLPLAAGGGGGARPSVATPLPLLGGGGGATALLGSLAGTAARTFAGGTGGGAAANGLKSACPEEEAGGIEGVAVLGRVSASAAALPAPTLSSRSLACSSRAAAATSAAVSRLPALPGVPMALARLERAALVARLPARDRPSTEGVSHAGLSVSAAIWSCCRHLRSATGPARSGRTSGRSKVTSRAGFGRKRMSSSNGSASSSCRCKAGALFDFRCQGAKTSTSGTSSSLGAAKLSTLR
mmetsp:Transcript_66148/g.115115  ORF Transcript_66148/g.115115 Transcript_66148/m.115115 type:complete len:286 (-) Transcript_66148:567-1424(-)